MREIDDARPADAEALARIHEDARRSAGVPNLHAFAETIAFHAGLIARMVVRVARDGRGRAIGYAARDGGWLEHLYVAPAAQGRGAGRALLADARRHGPLTLWCFAHNDGALRFYARHGAVVDPESESKDNEEHLPALRLMLSGKDR